MDSRELEENFSWTKVNLLLATVIKDIYMTKYDRKNMRHRAYCLKQSVKHPASVMIWGYVSVQGTGSLFSDP